MTVVDNIQALKGRKGTPNAVAIVLGLAEKFDGNPILFGWHEESNEAEISGQIVAVTGVLQGRWKRLLNNNTGQGSTVLIVDFQNLTDQTFTHNLNRYVSVTPIVGNEEIDVDVSYPSTNTVRVRSNTAITGKLIIQ